MKELRTTAEARALSGSVKAGGKRVGFVPTMGALHEGHLSLVKVAREHADFIVVSIFVNPTQFGPGEDYESYPRQRETDLAMCRERGVGAVFIPDRAELYGEGPPVWVEVEGMTGLLCGRTRPGHFRGVTTVVAKLFNAVEPDVAVFGLKDAQQFYVLNRMVQELKMPVELVPAPVVREPDGLAMSSRNRRLTPGEREQAPALYGALCAGKRLVDEGGRSSSSVTGAVRAVLSAKAPDFVVEYVECVSVPHLLPLEELRGRFMVALAGKFSSVRLIDNLHLVLPQ